MSTVVAVEMGLSWIRFKWIQFGLVHCLLAGCSFGVGSSLAKKNQMRKNQMAFVLVRFWVWEACERDDSFFFPFSFFSSSSFSKPSSSSIHIHSLMFFLFWLLVFACSNNGNMIKFEFFESGKSFGCHFAEIGSFVVSIAHYMRAYFNYQALVKGRGFSLPSDAGYLSVRRSTTMPFYFVCFFLLTFFFDFCAGTNPPSRFLQCCCCCCSIISAP